MTLTLSAQWNEISYPQLLLWWPTSSVSRPIRGLISRAILLGGFQIANNTNSKENTTTMYCRDRNFLQTFLTRKLYRMETCINISLFIGNWLVKLDNSLCQQEDQIIFVLGRDFQPSKLDCGEIFNINRANSVRRNKQRTSISQHFTLIDRTQSSVQQDRRQGRWPLWPISYSDHNSNFLVAAKSGKNTSLYSCMMWGVL